MSKLVAVQGCSVSYSSDTEGVQSISPVATLSSASGNPTSGGNKTYVESIQVSITAGSVVLSEIPAGSSSNTGVIQVGTITIQGSSTTTSSEGSSFVLEGDSGSNTFIALFTQLAGPNPIPVSISIKAEVSDAAQNVVKMT